MGRKQVDGWEKDEEGGDEIVGVAMTILIIDFLDNI